MVQTIRRAFTIGLAMTLVAVFGLVALFAPAAKAEDAPVNPTAVGNIDWDVARSITVHKYANPAFAGNRDGDVEPNAPAEGKLSGVEFSVAKVEGIDLTNFEDWNNVAGLKYVNDTVQDANGQTYSVGAETTQQTQNGETKFANLEAGVYLVREGADKGGNNITAKAAPFFVTVPLPAGEKGWRYDVHVYPKNSVTNVKKEVRDADAVKEGDIVNWDVTATVPLKAEDEEDFTSFIVEDTFDPRLTYAEELGVSVAGFDGMYDVEVSGQTVTVTFNAEGLNKLEGMRGADIVVTFPTTVNSVGEDGIIPNQATVFVNDPNKDSDGFKTNEPKTYWGEVQVLKFDQDDNSKYLNDAEFTIYASQADAEAGTNPIVSITTADNGRAKVMLKQGHYFIKETKAPAGYKLSSTVTEFTLNPEGKQDLGNKSVTLKYEVPNSKQDVPQLPLTGANGQLLLVVGGSALILAAVGVALVGYKRRNND